MNGKQNTKRQLRMGERLSSKSYAAEILKASEDGRSDDVTRLTTHLKVFRANGILMTPELYSNYITFGSQTHAARNRLLVAFREAAKQCIEELRFEKAEGIQATIKSNGLDSRLVSLRLAKRPIDNVMHGGYLGWVRPTPTKNNRMNATFEIVQGLSDPKAVSFRSVNVPNFYLSHGGNRVRLIEYRDRDAYRKNSTFFLHQGLGRRNAVLIVPVNFPTHAIFAKDSGLRQGRELWIEPIRRVAEFSNWAEFEIVEPQFPFWGVPSSTKLEP